jgi:hypothetical protein
VPAALAGPFLTRGELTVPPAVVLPHFRVVVVDRISASDLKALADRGAVGLLVPGAGAVTNRRYAIASLVRGLNVNPYLKTIPKSRPLLHVEHASSIPTRGRAIILALPPSGPLASNERRYPIAVVGAHYHGLLTSRTTRIAGLVSIVDVAPTALGRANGVLHSTASAHSLDVLTRLDGRISANNRLKLPTLIIIAIALIILARVRPRLALPAILSGLVTSLVAGAAQVSSEVALVAMVVGGTFAGGWLIARVCADERRMLAAIVVVLGLHLVLLLLRPEWVAITPLGPTQNARFWGIGNQLETLLLAPVVAGSALAAQRYGPAGFAAFALLGLLLVTDNRLGSDGGGAAVFGVALAFTGARTLRLGLRGFATLLLVNATVVLGVISLNLRVPGSDHLRSAFAHGVGGFVSVLVNRIPLAYTPAFHQWRVLVPLAVLFALALLAAIRSTGGRTRDLVLAAALAIATSLMLNDSATYELAGGAAVVAALAHTSISPQPIGLPQPRLLQLNGEPVRSRE